MIAQFPIGPFVVELHGEVLSRRRARVSCLLANMVSICFFCSSLSVDVAADNRRPCSGSNHSRGDWDGRGLVTCQTAASSSRVQLWMRVDITHRRQRVNNIGAWRHSV